MKRFLWLILIALAAPARADTAADISALVAMMPGVYDNPAQVAAAPKMPRLTTYIRKVDAPQFGEHVLYVEEIRNSDANNIARIRLYRFTAEGTDGTIRMHLINPTEIEKLKGAHKDIKRVEAMTAADVRQDRPACDVFLKRSGNGFTGAMKPKSCDRKDGEGRALFVAYDLAFDASSMRVRNRGLGAADDAVHFEQTPGGWLEQVKIAP